jgi:DNA-binding PadR family transcriptional regulator
MTPPPTPGPMPGRLLRFYALAVMEADGPLYGYSLAERIAERTEGAWRPGAGAIYPALEALGKQKLARATVEGRRRVYRITPAGRQLLRRIRVGMARRVRGGPDLSRLWSEIAGGSDPGVFMLENLRRRLDGLVSYVTTEHGGRARHAALREALRVELRLADARLGPSPSDVPPAAVPRARRPR